MRIFSFEKLIAWQKGRELAILIFKTTKNFPKDETYSSSLELLNQVILSHDFEYVDENQYTQIREKITEVNMLIDGLHKSQISNIK